jgi:hypothetical protein
MTPEIANFVAIYGTGNCTILVISGSRFWVQKSSSGPETVGIWLFLDLFLKDLFFFSTWP